MCKMGKIKMRKLNDLKVNEAFEQYVISKKARGVKDVTIRTITYHSNPCQSTLIWTDASGNCRRMTLIEWLWECVKQDSRKTQLPVIFGSLLRFSIGAMKEATQL